jgi:hypothetical protein
MERLAGGIEDRELVGVDARRGQVDLHVAAQREAQLDLLQLRSGRELDLPADASIGPPIERWVSAEDTSRNSKRPCSSVLADTDASHGLIGASVGKPSSGRRRRSRMPAPVTG